MENENTPIQKRRGYNGDVFGAILLITIGILLLLNNFGVLPWSIWESLWKLWPIFLVSAGLQLVAGDSWIANFVLGIVFAIVVWQVVTQVIFTNNSRLKTFGQLPDERKIEQEFKNFGNNFEKWSNSNFGR